LPPPFPASWAFQQRSATPTKQRSAAHHAPQIPLEITGRKARETTLGNPFPFDLSLVDKRRLLNILVAVYREKGTSAGISNAIRFFLGLEVDISSYAGESLLLGESLLGEDWVLGPSTHFSPYAFEVIVPRALSDEERRRLRTIVDYMKPAQTHFTRLVEPFIPEVIDHLELGLSELGETWLLH